MQRSKPRLAPLFIALFVIIIVIIAIISIGRAFFGGSGSTPAEESTDVGRDSLLNTATNRSVRLTVRGPIVANEDFKSYTIEASSSERVMNVYTGYLDQVTDSSKNGNNIQAYEQFVYALDKADMMRGTESEDENTDDIRGICATGYVYDYAVLQDSNVVKHLWTSTCDGSKGTLEASTSQLNDLFLKQIPNSSDLQPFRTGGFRLNF